VRGSPENLGERGHRQSWGFRGGRGSAVGRGRGSKQFSPAVAAGMKEVGGEW
jgi:hypothetical protein